MIGYSKSKDYFQPIRGHYFYDIRSRVSCHRKDMKAFKSKQRNTPFMLLLFILVCLDEAMGSVQ